MTTFVIIGLIVIALVGAIADLFRGLVYWYRYLRQREQGTPTSPSLRPQNSFIEIYGKTPRARQSFEEAHSLRGKGPRKDHILKRFQHNLALHYLTLGEYLQYCYTLRLEHGCDKVIQLCIYIFRRLAGTLSRSPSEAEAQVALLQALWSNSALTGYVGTKDLGKEHGTCYVFEFPHVRVTSENDASGHISVSSTIWVPVSNLKTNNNGKVLPGSTCIVHVDGSPCSATDYYALFYYGIISGFIHPRIHVMAGYMSQYHRRDGVFRNIHIYNTMMNDAAPVAAIANNHCPVALSGVLEANVAGGMWEHRNVVEAFGARNRFVRFIVEARRIIGSVIREEHVGINAEIFFLGSVLHSLDHSLLYTNTHFSGLLRSEKWGIDCSLFAHLFIDPPRGWFFCNTRMSAAKEPWIARIYAELADVDVEYAERVHYCIAW